MISLTKTIIGLDISSSSVKLLASKVRGNRLEIHFGMEEIPAKASSSIIAEAIRKIIAREKIKGYQTIGLLAGESVFIKYLFLPSLPDKELVKAVRWEIEKSGPFPVREAFFDYTIQRRLKDEKGNTKIEVLLAAARKDIIDKYSSIVTQAGLKLIGISIKPVIYEFVFNRLMEGKLATDAVVVLDFGKISSSLVVLLHGKTCLFREIPIGSNDLTEEIAERLNISWEVAEKIKCERGYPIEVELPSKETAPAQKESSQVFKIDQEQAEAIPYKDRELIQAMRPVLERLVSEIDRTSGYFHRQFPGQTISQLFLTGGGARLKNLTQFLSQRGLPAVSILNPLEKVEPKIPISADLATHLTLVTGLVDKKILNKINLLPSVSRRIGEKISQAILTKGLLRIFLPILVALLILVYLGFWQWIVISNNHLQQRKKDLQTLEKQFSLGVNVEQELQKIKKQIEELKKVTYQPVAWYTIFEILKDVIPSQKAWLTELNFRKHHDPGEKDLVYELELIGYALTQRDATMLNTQLAQVPYFKKSQLVSAEEVMFGYYNLDKVCAFKIILWLNLD